MKFKTMEEYILNELYKTKVELQLANKKIKELKEQPKNDNVNEENMNCIYLSDKPYYWYTFDIESEYCWNKTLKDNNETPKLVEKALTDDEALKQLCKLEGKDSWGSVNLGRIDERVYNYLFKGRNGLYSVIETRQDDSCMYNIGEKYKHYLSKEKAEEDFKKEMISRINYYLKNYKDKFEAENEKEN